MKKLVKKIFAAAGADIRRIHPEDNNYKWLEKYTIKTVIDIGANTGQFAAQIHEILPNADIFSFEPLADCFEKLLENMKSAANFKAFNLALGDKEDHDEIYRSEFSPSSSFLRMGDTHKNIYPHTCNSTAEKVTIIKLDTALHAIELKDNLLVKIDVQGYEDKVIAGGIDTISRANVIITEVSFEELYKGQPLFSTIYDMLVKIGFEYKGNLDPQRKNPVDGRVLQADSIFIKKEI